MGPAYGHPLLPGLSQAKLKLMLCALYYDNRQH